MTPVYLHFFATTATQRHLIDGNFEPNNQVGPNNRTINLELAATIHSTRESAETFRRKTRGVVVPTVVAQLPGILPANIVLDNVYFKTSDDWRGEVDAVVWN